MSSVVLLSRDDVINDPTLMGLWVEQNLKKMRLAKIEGCAMAINEFGNYKPFSNYQIYHLECMKPYKDKRKQMAGKIGANISNHVEQEPTKKQLLSKLSKLPKSKLKTIVNESANSSVMFDESMFALTKEY